MVSRWLKIALKLSSRKHVHSHPLMNLTLKNLKLIAPVLAAAAWLGCGTRSSLYEPRDVPTIPVDVPPLMQGAVCTSSAQCAVGLVCPEDPNIEHRCTTECQSNMECSEGTICVVNRRSAQSPQAVCSRSVSGTTPPDALCDSDVGCLSNACVQGRCRALCRVTDECLHNGRCEPNAAIGGLRACNVETVQSVMVEERRLFEGMLRPDTAQRGSFEIPVDTVAFTLTVQDHVDASLLAQIDELVDPNGAAVISSADQDPLVEPIIRSYTDLELSSVLVPADDRFRVVPGRYTYSVSLVNDFIGVRVRTERPATVLLQIKRAPRVLPSMGSLDIRCYFVPNASLSARTAPADPRFVAALAELRQAYAMMGVEVRVAEYLDVQGPEADRFTVIDSPREMGELFATTVRGRSNFLNLYFVAGISFGDAIGIAGSIVGPPGIHGTSNSGVIVDLDGTVPPMGEPDTIGGTIAHELGHYLGLWHTQESADPCTEPGEIDCSPWGGYDAIADTPNTPRGAINYVMYWAIAPQARQFSAGQARVVRGSPLITHR